jgi:hypothetical protein
MRFSPEILRDKETMRLMEARNHQSHSLLEAAQNMIRQATEIDLSNMATEILYKYPEADTVMFLEDQRTDYKDVLFCGHIDDENGNKIANSFEAKNFVEALLLEYKLAERKAFVVNLTINLREYALRVPFWFASRV